MRAVISVLLASVLLVAISACTTSKQAKREKQPTTETVFALPEGLHAEAQYRPGVDSSKYPLIEVYLHNQTSQPVEWKRASLNGNQLQMLTNGVVWFQFYPTEKANPGETVLLQVNLVANPRNEQTVRCETQDGRIIEVKLPPFSIPAVKMDAVTFSWDFRQMFVAYSPGSYFDCSQLVPSRVLVNGVDATATSELLSPPTLKEPAFLRVKLPEPTEQGRPMYVRLELRNGIVRHCLVRAWKGFFLDAFAVDEKNAKLRKALGLDHRPFGRHCGGDPACNDLALGRKYGASMDSVLEERKASWKEKDNRLSYVSLCTAATPNAAYSIYGQCMDAAQANPYRLHWSQEEKFVETEERYLRWCRQAASPRPWFWFPETFEVHGRILEAEELRLLACAAVGQGVKGINYFCHSYAGPPPVHGFDKSPRLLAEVRTLNRMFKKYEHIFSTAIPISDESSTDQADKMAVKTLWCGDPSGVLVVIRNMDYSTDRTPNEYGSHARFHWKPNKEPAKISIGKPIWMPLCKHGYATDLLSGRQVHYTVKDAAIWLDIQLDLASLIFIPS
jgi:hypothetical protein